MNHFQALILGAIQGITEFLPVSSSGHLVIAQHLFGISEPVLAFDIGVHVGTLMAVLLYFRTDLMDILASVLRWLRRSLRMHRPAAIESSDVHLKMAALIVAGSIPTAIIGLLFNKVAEQLFSSPVLVGGALLVTAAALWATRWITAEGGNEMAFSLPRAVGVGLVQGLAIVPGISRSGSTIAAGLFLGLNRNTAARFSFLLSIPAVAGAGLLGALDLMEGGGIAPLMIAEGLVASFAVGYGALAFLVYLVNRGRLHLFAPYCVLAAVVAVVIGL